MKTNHFKENREQLMVLSILITFLIPKSATGGKYAIWEETVPPLAGPPPHIHPDEEVFYVLEGEFEFMLNSALIPAKAGSVVHIPSNELHNYKNIGDKAGKLLNIITPGQLADYFHAVGQPVKSEADIADLNIVPDFANMDIGQALALAPEHAVTFHL
ncbi:cupin domain-containing protein [Mucilaginibacter corticis]|uniref:Cupin domain-containing protein n=1 Tax=Mucilaginibacter corticis TaxID=2597670 RepID=A0A556M4Q8_9SPHI|nr:cupin domain-containing protein [Mucilaginibacter corticis]TSJ34883.1 cupin domain-containing protein [Mucilaginibacter corticis]